MYGISAIAWRENMSRNGASKQHPIEQTMTWQLCDGYGDGDKSKKAKLLLKEREA